MPWGARLAWGLDWEPQASRLLREGAGDIPSLVPQSVSLQEFCSKPPLFPCILYGPTCDASDQLFEKESQLPELDVGDWLIFASMRACSLVVNSTFNGFLPASIYYTMGPSSGIWVGCKGGCHQNLSLAPGAGPELRVPRPRKHCTPPTYQTDIGAVDEVDPVPRMTHISPRQPTGVL